MWLTDFDLYKQLHFIYTIYWTVIHNDGNGWLLYQYDLPTYPHYNPVWDSFQFTNLTSCPLQVKSYFVPKPLIKPKAQKLSRNCENTILSNASPTPPPLSPPSSPASTHKRHSQVPSCCAAWNEEDHPSTSLYEDPPKVAKCDKCTHECRFRAGRGQHSTETLPGNAATWRGWGRSRNEGCSPSLFSASLICAPYCKPLTPINNKKQ